MNALLLVLCSILGWFVINHTRWRFAEEGKTNMADTVVLKNGDLADGIMFLYLGLLGEEHLFRELYLKFPGRVVLVRGRGRYDEGALVEATVCYLRIDCYVDTSFSKTLPEEIPISLVGISSGARVALKAAWPLYFRQVRLFLINPCLGAEHVMILGRHFPAGLLEFLTASLMLVVYGCGLNICRPRRLLRGHSAAEFVSELRAIADSVTPVSQLLQEKSHVILSEYDQLTDVEVVEQALGHCCSCLTIDAQHADFVHYLGAYTRALVTQGLLREE